MFAGCSPLVIRSQSAPLEGRRHQGYFAAQPTDVRWRLRPTGSGTIKPTGGCAPENLGHSPRTDKWRFWEGPRPSAHRRQSRAAKKLRDMNRIKRSSGERESYMRSKLLYQNSFALLIVAVLAILFGASEALAQTTSFTYQGRLTDGGTAANGNYDLQFALFDSPSGGTQIGSTQTLNTVAVSNGVFTVSLDFGAN